MTECPEGCAHSGKPAMARKAAPDEIKGEQE
jgi:hypothetical protein